MEPRHEDVHVVRVQLPDRPGALGAVTSRIGAVGGDVLAIEVVDRTEGSAVDELVVDLPEAATVDLLRRELGEIDGVVVERVAALQGPWLDPRMAALTTAEALLVAADRDTVLDFLCARVVHDLRSAWAGAYDAAGDLVVEAESGLRPPPEEPAPASEREARADLASNGYVVLARRSVSRFRPHEHEVLAALARLADARLTQLGPRPGDHPA